MVGGAPATQRWADRIGADAYGVDAADAAEKAMKLLGGK
jgi:trimethylamine corrinoid protein